MVAIGHYMRRQERQVGEGQMTAPTFDHIKDPEFRSRLETGQKRGAFQGWIGDYAVYQKDGVTHGYHQSNKGLEPEYTGSENGLYAFAGRTPFVEHRTI